LTCRFQQLHAHGQAANHVDATGTTTYTQDNRDRLKTKATPEGTLSYSYDGAGDVKTIQSSNAGEANLAYGYDGLNRLSTVADGNGTTSDGYDAAGNLQSVTYPNGVVHNYSYNVKNQLTNLAVNNSSGAIASYGYTLDPAGHRTQVTELSGRTVKWRDWACLRFRRQPEVDDLNGAGHSGGDVLLRCQRPERDRRLRCRGT
jgi:YD repeat-containing protein